MTALAHGLEELVEHLVEELLALHVAESSTTIVVLELVEVLVFRPVLCEVGIGGEGIEIGEHGIAFDVSGVADVEVCGVGIHGAYLLPYLVGGVGEIDAVAEALRHLLLAIGAGEAACGEVLGEHDLRLYEDGRIDLVEAAHELACDLEHGLLVFACGHGGSLEERDVGSLRDGIAEEAERDVGFEVAHLDLRLHRGIALHARDGDEVHEIGGELGKLGDMALDEEDALLGVETCSHPVEGDVDYALAELLGVFGIVGECLHVSHEHKHFFVAASVLQFDAAAE